MMFELQRRRLIVPYILRSCKSALGSKDTGGARTEIDNAEATFTEPLDQDILPIKRSVV